MSGSFLTKNKTIIYTFQSMKTIIYQNKCNFWNSPARKFIIPSFDVISHVKVNMFTIDVKPCIVNIANFPHRNTLILQRLVYVRDLYASSSYFTVKTNADTVRRNLDLHLFLVNIILVVFHK